MRHAAAILILLCVACAAPSLPAPEQAIERPPLRRLPLPDDRRIFIVEMA